MKAKWTSRIPETIEELTGQVVDRINAKADAYAEDVKAKLLQGYTTGAFVTGETAESVTVEYATPEQPQASVGSDSIVAVAWELGHLDIFTRRFERVEHWRDAAIELAAKGATE